MNEEGPGETPFRLDQQDLAAIDVLIAACDRRLGRQAPASRDLRRLRDAPTRIAWDSARQSFDQLTPELRTEISAEASVTALSSRRAAPRRQQPESLGGLLGAINRRPPSG